MSEPRRHRLFAVLLILGGLAAPRGGSAQGVSEVPMGAEVQGQGPGRFVTFRVWAPNAGSVEVSGKFNGWKKEALRPEPSRPGHWTLDSHRARPGDAYRFVLDGLERRDPRARAVNQEENTGMILDPRGFPWGPAQSWKMPPRESLVMYEMHLGTFAGGVPGSGSLFQRAARRLPYLKALGINCIQLMPVNEFPGDRSWGYNPGDLFAIESSYGGADAFRAFVRTCHTNGIAVLLDIVHNHYGPDRIAAWQFDQRLPAGDGGIYFYRDAERATTPWGPRPDFSRPEVRTFILDSVRMFLEEYRLDGFRWDSVHNIRYVQEGARSNADGDRLLSDANAWMAKHHPDALRIAEDHAFDAGGVGFEAQWHSAFQTTLSTLVRVPDDQRNLALLAEELERMEGFQWVVFAECHDSAGDLNQHQRLPAHIDPADPDSAKARALALVAGGIALTVPGYPMMLQGFEMHDTEPFSDRSPISWARAQGPYKGIVRAHADLIHLRRNLKGYTPGLQGEELRVVHGDNDAKVLAYLRRQRNAPRDKATMVVVNLSGTPRKGYGVRFPSSGSWFCHYNSGSSAYAKDFDNLGPMPGQGYTLPPGQNTLPLDLSRYSIQVFSQTRPPNATLARAPAAQEAPEWTSTAPEPVPVREIEKYVEEILEPFPYVVVPLPAEWKP
ncbi:MAG: 1,4-alpha-glucan branching protein [Opitutae bacterium]|nr:1,4-alpha-glucan branching protein [Opitutae bacterium]